MYFTRLLVFVLICTVTPRDDGGLFLRFISNTFTLASVDGPNDIVRPSEEEEAWEVEGNDETDGSDGWPDNERSPGEHGELPFILELELDSESEEMEYDIDHKAYLGIVVHCLLHADDSSPFASFTSFCTLKRLRT